MSEKLPNSQNPDDPEPTANNSAEILGACPCENDSSSPITKIRLKGVSNVGKSDATMQQTTRIKIIGACRRLSPDTSHTGSMTRQHIEHDERQNNLAMQESPRNRICFGETSRQSPSRVCPHDQHANILNHPDAHTQRVFAADGSADGTVTYSQAVEKQVIDAVAAQNKKVRMERQITTSPHGTILNSTLMSACMINDQLQSQQQQQLQQQQQQLQQQQQQQQSHQTSPPQHCPELRQQQQQQSPCLRLQQQQAPQSSLQEPQSSLQAPPSRLQEPCSSQTSRLEAPQSRLQEPCARQTSRLEAPQSRLQAPQSRLQEPCSSLQTSALQAPQSTLQAPQSRLQEPCSSLQTSRLEAPQSRLQAPQSGLQAPQSGLQAPQSRLQAPQSRLQAPQSRLQAPQSRLQAPPSRLQSLQTSRLQALQSRLEAIRSKLQAPQSRSEAPQSRLQAPQSRLQAPQSRLQAPQSRLQAPQSRLQAPQSRLQAPQSRLQAPQARLQAPPGRLQAPQARLQAPPGRLQAPPGRLQAPQARLQAPPGRLQAPQARLQAPQSRSRTPSPTLQGVCSSSPTSRLRIDELQSRPQTPQSRLQESSPTRGGPCSSSPTSRSRLQAPQLGSQAPSPTLQGPYSSSRPHTPQSRLQGPSPTQRGPCSSSPTSRSRLQAPQSSSRTPSPTSRPHSPQSRLQAPQSRLQAPQSNTQDSSKRSTGRSPCASRSASASSSTTQPQEKSIKVPEKEKEKEKESGKLDVDFLNQSYIPQSAADATIDEVRNLLEEEKRDVLQSQTLSPELETKLRQLKKKTLLEETLQETIPQQDALDGVNVSSGSGSGSNSDVLASLMHSEECGVINTVSSPKRMYDALFGASGALEVTLEDERSVAVSPASPSPLNDIVVPVGEATQDQIALLMPEIEYQVAQTDQEIPKADAYSESVHQGQSPPVYPARRNKGHTPPGRPPMGYIPRGEMEEEKAPWDIDLGSLEDLVGGQLSVLSTGEQLPSDESIRATLRRFEYILDVEKPKHYSCVQLRGTQRPSWFPGYFFVHPENANSSAVSHFETENYVKLEQDPSKVFAQVWNIFKPDNLRGNSEVVIL